MTAQKAISQGKDEKIPPRNRILAAAGDLCYHHGIRAVGVEAIAEAAGTNKMSAAVGERRGCLLGPAGEASSGRRTRPAWCVVSGNGRSRRRLRTTRVRARQRR